MNVDRPLVTLDDMRTYKRILESQRGRLSENELSGPNNTTRGPKYRDVIFKLFPADSRRGVDHIRGNGGLTIDNGQVIFRSLKTILVLVVVKPHCSSPQATTGDDDGRDQRLPTATRIPNAQAFTKEFSLKSVHCE